MTQMFVAATGGHLAQLATLASRIVNDQARRVWVTFDSPQSRSLLKGKDVEFITPVEERDVRGTLRAVVDARRLFRKYRPTAVYSTGSAVAVSFLNLATFEGIPAYYIESAARVSDISMTGRLLSWNPKVKLHRQYDFLARPGWKYAGSVFDTFASAEARPVPLRNIRNVVVTFGTGTHPFRRLLSNLISIIPPDANVLWQTGSTPTAELGINAQAEVPSEVLNKAIAMADVVIGHAGCGTALSALNAGKVPILAPRTKIYGELVDDHQIAISSWLEKRGLALSREAGKISSEDLTMAASLHVHQVPYPPPLKLAS